MKRTPVDVTGLFELDKPKIYENSKDYLRALEIDELVEVLYTVNDRANYDNINLIRIVEMNYFFDGGVELGSLDDWQMNGLKSEIECILLQKILNEYEKSLEAEKKVIDLF